MTEKRFENRLDKSNVKFNTLNPTWDNEKETGLNVFEIIDELNNLSEKNEVLKSTNMEYEDALGRLEKENERIKHMIQEAYNNERTKLGQSVLKQLINNIEVK